MHVSLGGHLLSLSTEKVQEGFGLPHLPHKTQVSFYNSLSMSLDKIFSSTISVLPLF